MGFRANQARASQEPRSPIPLGKKTSTLAQDRNSRIRSLWGKLNFAGIEKSFGEASSLNRAAFSDECIVGTDGLKTIEGLDWLSALIQLEERQNLGIRVIRLGFRLETASDECVGTCDTEAC